MEVEVRKKEDDVYRIQLRLLEIQLRLLEEEERKLRLEERYIEGAESVSVARRLEYLPSKMSKLRLKMWVHEFVLCQTQNSSFCSNILLLYCV